MPTIAEIAHEVLNRDEAVDADDEDDGTPDSPPSATAKIPSEPGPSTVGEQPRDSPRLASTVSFTRPSAKPQSPTHTSPPIVPSGVRRPAIRSSSASQHDGERPGPELYSDPFRAKFVHNSSSFRGALEYNDVDGWGKGREKEKEPERQEGDRRQNGPPEGDGIVKKLERIEDYFHHEHEHAPEHDRERADGHDADDEEEEGPEVDSQRAKPNGNANLEPPAASSQARGSVTQIGHRLARYHSLPHFQSRRGSQSQAQGTSQGQSQIESARPQVKSTQSRWAVLRSRLLNSEPAKRSQTQTAFPLAPKSEEPASAVGDDINLTNELIAGSLSGLMLRMYFERDEQDQRRVPVFLHHLKIRVSDSLHPLHNTHAVFRIECEYANGAARWVIYRELRDLLSLHTHYRIANAYAWGNRVEIPEFPRTSLPYFNRLRREGREKGYEVTRADFARLQREALENYLIGLIRTTMFRAEANRLCRFFEISALSVSLAQRGGVQGKAGVLRVVAGHASRKEKGHSLTVWKKNHDPKWWLVRDSYMVAVDTIADTEIYDVFLFDTDFVIERPKRYYRQGLNFLHLGRGHPDLEEDEDAGRRSHTDAESDDTETPQSPRRRKLFANLLKTHGAGSKDSGNQGAEKDQPNTTTESHEPPGAQDTLTVDPSTGTDPRANKENDKKKKSRSNVSQHTFYIQNSQRRLKLIARSERQMHQWIASIDRMAAKSVWKGKNRFDSFAPIRLNAAAQWLVDGRDYFWNLSRAMLLAKERIYIHDWWLSPELYMRRPNKEHYRLDQILKKKAREGVKIYVVIYQEVSSRTTPTDSNYAKQKLMGLHPNIMVQRSPSHFATGNFYWAHHEKLCVIDEAIAFMGGFDLCFGRWDTSEHILIDQGVPGGHGEDAEVWPGKDYNNGRVSDFYGLNKPFEDMHDRSKVPRMPWHDVGVQMVGQPARDLCRHFVQRWNWLLRVKAHTRVMPFLMPPPDFDMAELDAQGLTGTCEVQICRSCGPWSMGTQSTIEMSIQNAYLKAIQMSEHFIYIENQFFITSTMVDDVKVENKIGDALVSRIIRAHHEGTPWRACIVIPLLPGFAFPIDHSDASSVRIILECQNRTIARGPDSIFARLRKEGIDPDDYITFFSLRGWGKFDSGVLTTEQVYIHGKTMLVDDRIALIGSANINERSQRGDRDSELVVVIRDTDMIDGRMAGKPYKVGRFVHTLRMRLMREHVGVDVDAIYNDDLMASTPVRPAEEIQKWDPEQEQSTHPEEGVTQVHHHFISNRVGRAYERDVTGQAGQLAFGVGEITSHASGRLARKVRDKLGLKSDHIDAIVEDKTIERERHYTDVDGKSKEGFASSIVPTLEEKVVSEHRPKHSENGEAKLEDLPEQPERMANGHLGSDDDAAVRDVEKLFSGPALSSEGDDQPSGEQHKEDIALPAQHTMRAHLDAKVRAHPWTVPTPAPEIDPDGFTDPLAPGFFEDVWIAAAVHNTEVFRKVFRCVPDDLVTTWKQYKEYCVWQERLDRPPKGGDTDEPVGLVPSEDEGVAAMNPDQPKNLSHIPGDLAKKVPGKGQSKVPSSPEDNPPSPGPGESETTTKAEGSSTAGGNGERKPSRPDEPFEQWERDEMEDLLHHVKGHLVLYPTRFLEGEDMANNFLFTSDRILPMPIYD